MFMKLLKIISDACMFPKDCWIFIRTKWIYNSLYIFLKVIQFNLYISVEGNSIF